jgi:hypothetical protein
MMQATKPFAVVHAMILAVFIDVMRVDTRYLAARLFTDAAASFDECATP